MWNEWSTLKKLIFLKAAGVIGGGPSWVWQLLTGTAPLALLDAVAHPIHSLTQYGLCVQDGTPTPDAPVDILCNNGALRMVDDELPAAYKRVLGFSCDNNALWEITGFQLKGSDTVRISFSINAACNVFGCYQGASANDNYDLYASVSSGSKYFRYADGTYLSYFSPENVGKRFDVVYTPNGSQGMPQDSTWTPKTFTSANNLLIGSTTLTGASSKLKGNLYGSFVVDERLKLIPCERVSDGVLGYYDTYGATFYEPYEGFDGAVSLGYDGSHYTLGVVGTPETLTVSGKNLLDQSQDVALQCVGATGQEYAVGPLYGHTAFIPVKPNTAYTWSGLGSVSAVAVYRGAMYSDASFGSFVSNITGPGSSTSTFTTTADTRFVVLNVQVAEETQQLELGSTATAYEPYVQPQTVTGIPMLLGVGDYNDEGELISGIKTGKVGVKVLDGTEGWSTSSYYGTSYYLNTANSKWGAKISKVMCTHFAGINPPASTSTPDDTCFFNVHGHFYFRTNSFADMTAFTNWLAAQYAAGTPVIILYPLAEPVTEQGAAHSLHTSAGTNVVAVTANVSPVELAVEYAKQNA